MCYECKTAKCSVCGLQDVNDDLDGMCQGTGRWFLTRFSLIWPFLCIEDCDVSSEITNRFDEFIYQWGKGMIKLLTKKISLLICLLAGVGMTAPLTAQQNKTSQGNIIQKVSTVSQKGETILLIRGILDPGQLEDITIVKKGATSFVISIPNALIDPEKIPTPSQKFSLREPVKNIDFVENIREVGDDVVFIVDLEIEARNELNLELLPPVTSSTIRIKMEDLVVMKETEKAAQSEMANKKEVEEKARQMAVMKKAEDTMKERRTTADAQKTVADILQQYHRPSIMQLSIINASGWQKRAYKLSVFLGKEKKKEIEESLGIKLDIVNISNAKNDLHNQSTIYFRSNFLKPALFLAKMIPGEQKLVPISDKRERLGVDIEIYLGVDYK